MKPAGIKRLKHFFPAWEIWITATCQPWISASLLTKSRENYLKFGRWLKILPVVWLLWNNVYNNRLLSIIMGKISLIPKRGRKKNVLRLFNVPTFLDIFGHKKKFGRCLKILPIVRLIWNKAYNNRLSSGIMGKPNLKQKKLKGRNVYNFYERWVGWGEMRWDFMRTDGLRWKGMDNF